MRDGWRHSIVAGLVAVSVTIIVQVAYLLVWGGRVDVRQSEGERRDEEMRAVLSRLDERGSRQLPVLDDRVKLLEARVAALQEQSTKLTPLQQAIVDALKQNTQRIEEQQIRIIQAIDSSYNLLQEHLRNSCDATKNIPLPPLNMPKPPP